MNKYIGIIGYNGFDIGVFFDYNGYSVIAYDVKEKIKLNDYKIKYETLEDVINKCENIILITLNYDYLSIINKISNILNTKKEYRNIYIYPDKEINRDDITEYIKFNSDIEIISIIKKYSEYEIDIGTESYKCNYYIRL